MLLDFLYPAFFLLALNFPSTTFAAKAKNAILLSEVRVPSCSKLSPDKPLS